jgi:hypothetical protein
MLDYQPRSKTYAWPQPTTRPSIVPGFDPTAATMAQPIAGPSYAWSDEPAGFDGAAPAPTNRWSRMLRPAALACGAATAVAAVAAAAVVVFGNPTAPTAVAAPIASTPVVNTQAAVAPRPTATSASTPTPTPATHHQVWHSQPSTASMPITTTQPSTQQVPQQGYQWQPRHDTEPQWHWNPFWSHFNGSHHHDHHFDSSSDGDR